MAATIITVESAVQVLAQVVPLIQQALASGQTTIDTNAWNQATTVRDAALTKLDTDIAAQTKVPGP